MDEQINLGINIENSDVKKLGVEFTKVDEYVQNIVTHLTQVENKIVKLQNVTKNITNSTTNKKGTFIDNNLNTIVGAGGTAVSSPSTRTNAYRQAAQDYHNLQVEEIKLKKEEINTEQTINFLKKEQAKVVKQDADSRRLNAEAKRETARFRNSAEHLAYEQGLADKHSNLAGWYKYKSEHPERFLAGGLNANWYYQGGKMLQGVGNQLTGLGVGGRIAGDILTTAGSFLKAPAAGVNAIFTNLAKGLIDLSKAATQAYAEIESIKTQLGVVFSNQSQADSMFGQISQYAVKSPFGVQQTSELAVLLKQSGVYASDLMSTLRMIGDTAGGNMEKMKRIANNYAQIVSIGKASMLDMRQFAYAGIPIFEAVSKELGVSQQELRKLISDGKVTSDIIEKVFKDLTGINGIFENATEKGAKTLKARLQNLADAKQLALSSIGEYGVQFGSVTGNDSYVNSIVTTAENIYQWLQSAVDTRNIEKSVNVIENRNNRITELQNILEYLKANGGNKSEIKEVEKQLAEELAKRDVEAERVAYYNSYSRKNNNYDKWQSEFEASGITSDMKRMWAELGYSSKDYFTLQDYQAVADMFGLDSLSVVIKELIKATDGLKTITEEEVRANRETNLINAQQLAFDQTQKAASKEGSFASAFDKLYSLYTQSDEYKQQKEKEEIALLKKAQEVLKDIAKYTDEEGNLDITKLSYGKYSSYLNDVRALDPSKKLTIVEGKSDAQMTEDRAVLSKQWNKVSKDISNELRGKNFNAYTQFEQAMRSENLSTVKDNKTYFDNFDKILEKQLEILKTLSESATTEEDKKYYADMLSNLFGSTFRFSVNTKGINANPEASGSNGNQFIPLWKRILAGATGLSTQGMTGTLQTLENYKNDMAVRNMASSVMSAAMKSMGVDTAMGLIRTSGGAKVLRGDTGATYQVDWKETRKAIKEFSLSLSASTEVITAYKNSLQQELDTYEQLVAAGYTEAESQDLKNQKTISTKALEKLSQDAGDQLVNAFGEGLKTKSGKTAYFNGTNFVDDKGNKLQEEEIVLTGNLFEFIKKELPRLREEIHEANVAELNNNVLKQMFEYSNATSLLGNYLKSGASSSTLAFLNKNPDYANEYVNSRLNVLRNQIPVLSQLTNTQVLTNAYGYDEEYVKNLKAKQDQLNKERKELEKKGDYKNADIKSREAADLATKINQLTQSSVALDSIFKWLEEDLNNLIDSPIYQQLLGKSYTKEKEDALNAAMISDMTFMQNNNALKMSSPDMYGGMRGLRNRAIEMITGGTMKYDKEDYYSAAATMRLGVGQTHNAYGISGSRINELQGIYDSTLASTGSDVEAAKAVEKALSASEKHMIEIKRNAEEWKNATLEAGQALTDSFKQFGKDMLSVGTKEVANQMLKLAGYTRDTADSENEFEENAKKAGIALLNNVGAAMTTAGFNIAAGAALTQQWGIVAAGLGLAAAGGVVSGFGSILGEDEKNDNKTDSQIDKLNQLKDDLADLLDQARTDALYYERNLRHKTALGINEQFAYKSVHDAVITPRGDVVKTDPKDYLIATKTPGQLSGASGVTVTPVINNTVINNTSAKVSQEQQVNADGSIDIVTMIEEVTGAYIASSRSDDVFNARSYRLNGKQSIM